MQGTFHFYYKYYAKYLKYLQKYFNEKYIDTKFFFWTFVDKFKLNNIISSLTSRPFDCWEFPSCVISSDVGWCGDGVLSPSDICIVACVIDSVEDFELWSSLFVI
jgi:hypothetical protein